MKHGGMKKLRHVHAEKQSVGRNYINNNTWLDARLARMAHSSSIVELPAWNWAPAAASAAASCEKS